MSAPKTTLMPPSYAPANSDPADEYSQVKKPPRPSAPPQGPPIIPRHPENRRHTTAAMIPLAGAAPPLQRRPTSLAPDPTAPILGLPPRPHRQGNSRLSGAGNVSITEAAPPMRPPKPMPAPLHPLSRQRPSTFPGKGEDITSNPPEAQQSFQPNRDAKRVPILERMNLPVRPDDTFTSDRVLSLNSTNFTKFLDKMDITLVVFYNKGSPQMEEFEPIISQAACSTQRSNHAYAGVDCTLNDHLCQLNDAIKLPLVRIYAKTACVGQMNTLRSLTAETLRQFVEMAPGTESPQLESCPRKKKGGRRKKTIIIQQ